MKAALSHRPAWDGRLSVTELSRAILGVAVGYPIFAAAEILSFWMVRRAAQSPGHALWIAFALLTGIAYAGLSGYVCVAVAGRAARTAAAALAGGIALFVCALAVSRGGGMAWIDVVRLAALVPAAVGGAVVRLTHTRRLPPVHRDRP